MAIAFWVFFRDRMPGIGKALVGVIVVNGVEMPTEDGVRRISKSAVEQDETEPTLVKLDECARHRLSHLEGSVTLFGGQGNPVHCIAGSNPTTKDIAHEIVLVQGIGVGGLEEGEQAFMNCTFVSQQYVWLK